MAIQPEHADNPSPPAETAEPSGPPAKDTVREIPAAGTVLPPAPPPAPLPALPALPHHKIRRTRISGTWAAMISFAVVLLLLLIFILQNSRTVEVSYFGAHGHLPLGVALLLAAVGGVLLVALAGGTRIVQLRRTARRHRRVDAAQQAAARRGRRPELSADATPPKPRDPGAAAG